MSGYHLTKEEVDQLEDSFDTPECEDFVKILLQYDLSEEVHCGIAKQYLSNGYNSLSDKQKYIFKTFIIQPHTLKCEMCDEFNWDEADYIRDNNTCPHCNHLLEDE